MPIHAHSTIDAIPSWAEHEPDEVVTHAIQIYKDTYILHMQPRYGSCYLTSQWFDEKTQTTKWLHSDKLPIEAQDMLNITLDLCNRLIHGDDWKGEPPHGKRM